MYAEAVQVLGTIVTIAGLVVVAPYEAGRVVPDTWRAIRSGGRQARGWLARWLPFLRRSGTLHAVSGGSVAMGGGTGLAIGRVVLSEQGTAEEQLAALRRAIDSIYSELAGLRDGQNALKAELTQRLDQLGRDLADLRIAVLEHQQTQRQLNAKGFPLAALGALLAGTPGSCLVALPADPVVAPSPTWAWWLLLALGLVGLIVALRWMHSPQDLRRGQQGWGVQFADGWRGGWVEARPPRPARRLG